jgi:hypothetical protein
VIISFAWTTPALLVGAKTVTRREWKPEYASRFTVGMLVDAWDRSPRTGKGRKVATIRIKRAPRRESTAYLTGEDWDREGFTWLAAHGLLGQVEAAISSWTLDPRAVFVVEFELVDVGPYSATGGRPLVGGVDAKHLSNRRGQPHA